MSRGLFRFHSLAAVAFWWQPLLQPWGTRNVERILLGLRQVQVRPRNNPRSHRISTRRSFLGLSGFCARCPQLWLGYNGYKAG